MLTKILLHQFRCFSQFQTDLHPRFNFISGENGVGKTAFLEAVALLCSGQSFRVHETAPLIQAGQTQFALMTHLEDTHVIGLQKTQTGNTSIKINGQPCRRMSELVSLLPSQVIYQDIFQIIDAGPTMRRQLLDWGLFHMHSTYHHEWKQYQQALKQRNLLLKNRANADTLLPWNLTLDALAIKLDEARQEYLIALQPVFKHFLNALTALECEMHYYNGWSRESDKSLADVLAEHYWSDFAKQYTQLGPHHADLEMVSPVGQVKKFFSRGQQKMLLFALKLAQAQLLNKPCVYLWDDVCSELDEGHLSKLSTLLHDIPGQYFISGIHIEKSPFATMHDGKVLSLSREMTTAE